MEPNYIDQGLSSTMGPQLRALVEHQLLADLQPYGIDSTGLRFDWSASCIEGHGTECLDGRVENYSGIALFDAADQPVAEGWMEFVLDDSFFLAYWDSLDVWVNGEHRAGKATFGMPDHIWQQLPTKLQARYQDERIKKPLFQ